MHRRTFLGALPLLLAARHAATADDADDAPWQRLAAGAHVVLMRHAATVPGIGDPPGFDVNVCSTQRLLSEAGRDSARRSGAAFRDRAIPLAEVLSSRWCRCLDSARLAFGRAEPAPMLDSMFNDDDAARRQKVDAVHRYLAARQAAKGGATGAATGAGNLVLVTHDINIRALVGESVAQGQIVVATIGSDGRLQVTGTMAAPG